MTIHVRKGRIALHGTLPLYDRRNLDRILAVIEAHGFTPSTCGLDERGGSRYSRAVALNLLADPPMEFDETDVVIRQKKPTSYFAAADLSTRSGIWFDFDSKQPEGTWSRMFTLADALANVFEPDWGGAGFGIDLDEGASTPLTSGYERDAESLSGAGNLARVDYIPHGPKGLAMRTYIGPFFADQLGRERIETLPLLVEKLSWGGYRVDLVPEPWKLELPPMVDAWRRGMAHLRDAGIFAVPAAKPTFASRLDPGPNAKLR